MATIYGLARLTATDYAYVNNMNQELLYQAVQQYVEMANAAMMGAVETFVETPPTTNFKEKYQLPMSGRMQKVSEEGTGAPVARSSGWDVAYPLDNYHEALVRSDVDAAYMTPQEFQAHIDGIITRARNAKRFEILKRLFNGTQSTFNDKRHGSLTIEGLANGDSVVYPPVEGSESEATDNHYLESGYAASGISDTNNPFDTLATELIEHGINTTNDVPLAFFINSAQRAKTVALTNFIPYIPNQVRAGSNTDQVLMPARNIPGKIIGYMLGAGWVSEWAWVPANYILSVNLAAPQPLRMRVDPAETNLGSGDLVLLPDERNGVQTFRSWRLRFGVGGANRIGAAVMELGTGGSYTIPTDYQ